MWYNTVEEALFNLRLLPNRAQGQAGFLTYDTEGHLKPDSVASKGVCTPLGILPGKERR